MARPRLLIPITYQFSIRYIIRSRILEQVQDFAQPILAFSWRDERLLHELQQAGVEVCVIPETRYGPEYRRVRRTVDTWHQYQQLRSVSTSINERRLSLQRSTRARLIHRARTYQQLLHVRLLGKRHLLSTERILVEEDTNINDFRALLIDLQPDALFSVTPYHRQEDLLLRAAVMLGMPTSTSIISFDNLTTRGWIPILFDLYLLWNHYNRAELIRAYPEALSRRIELVGPVQFDFYWDDDYFWTRDEWRRQLSLPSDRPVILYAGSASIHVPHEPLFLQQLDGAIGTGEIPGEPLILFRRHPMDDIERWRPVLQQAIAVISDEPWAKGSDFRYANIDERGIKRLSSTLRHTDVHVNVCSTMALDGAIFDKPQIGPAYDDRPGRKYDRTTRELYEKEHFRPLVMSGGVEVVHSRDEFVRAVRNAIRDPQQRQCQRKQMVKDLCTFTDGKSAERVTALLRQFLQVV